MRGASDRVKAHFAKSRSELIAALALFRATCTSRQPAEWLVLITSDSLRADRVGAYGSPLGLTPNLDAFMQQSQVFRMAFSPCSHALTAVAALMTGRYPELLGLLSVPDASSRTISPSRT